MQYAAWFFKGCASKLLWTDNLIDGWILFVFVNFRTLPSDAEIKRDWLTDKGTYCDILASQKKLIFEVKYFKETKLSACWRPSAIGKAFLYKKCSFLIFKRGEGVNIFFGKLCLIPKDFSEQMWVFWYESTSLRGRGGGRGPGGTPLADWFLDWFY